MPHSDRNAESSQSIRDEASKQVPNRPVELVAVINSYNRKALLERAITSLMEALRKAPFESAVVVFEAGSNDGSKEFLEEWRRRYPGDPLVVVTPQDERASFSDGVNSGCAAAIARFPSCRWLLLYETDNSLEQAEPLRAGNFVAQRRTSTRRRRLHREAARQIIRRLRNALSELVFPFGRAEFGRALEPSSA